MMLPVFTMTDCGGRLEVFEDTVTITPKGFRGFLTKGFAGTRTILISSIAAVQFRKAGLITSGYIRFTLPGAIESRRLIAAQNDENTFVFVLGQNDLATKIKDYIETRMESVRTAPPTAPVGGLSEELQKLAEMRERGILSEEEFASAKKRLLG
jgi:hypothetical protein